MKSARGPGEPLREVATALRQPWQRALGPFLEADEATFSLDCNMRELSDLVAERRVLGLRDDSGAMLVASFTLESATRPADGLRPPDELRDVLRALERTTDEAWLWCLWLSGTLPKHGGWCAMDLVLAHRSDLVLPAARNEDWECLAE